VDQEEPVPRHRSIADRERDNQAVELRRRGLSHRQIAAQMGYKSPSSAYDAIERALAESSREAHDEVRALELGRLDDMRRICWRILASKHITVSQGRVITHPETGEIVTDDMPLLQAIDRLLRISERTAKLLGLDAPVRAHVEVQDGLDAEIEQLITQLAGASPGREIEAPRPAGSGTSSPPGADGEAVALPGEAEATPA
jgi:hypothetical protein